MSKVIYQQPNIVEVIFDEAARTIIVNWTKLGPHDFIRPCIEAQIDCTKKNKAAVLIVNTAKATGVPSQEDQGWFGSYVFPTLQAAGMKAVITVISESALTKMAARQWKNTGKQFGMEFIEAADFEGARAAAAKFL